MARVFTLRQARALLPEVRRHADAFTRIRANLVELTASLRAGTSSPLGGVAEVKAAEARLDEILSWFTAEGLELKGFAPLLLDFPADLGDGPVLLCWLEGETDLRWWHRREVGFAGRRPLPDELA